MACKKKVKSDYENSRQQNIFVLVRESSTRTAGERYQSGEKPRKKNNMRADNERGKEKRKRYKERKTAELIKILNTMFFVIFVVLYWLVVCCLQYAYAIIFSFCLSLYSLSLPPSIYLCLSLQANMMIIFMNIFMAILKICGI